jgi:hypothetical protein
MSVPTEAHPFLELIPLVTAPIPPISDTVDSMARGTAVFTEEMGAIIDCGYRRCLVMI